MDLNLNQSDFFRDPYPYYALIRASGKPFWLPHNHESGSGGVWLFSRYEDALTIFKKNSAISMDIQSVQKPGSSSPFFLGMLYRDNPDHLRLRRLVADYFSTQYLNNLEPHIVMVADKLIHSLKKKGSFDLVADFAEPLPLYIITRMIGVPEDDIMQVRAWSLALGPSFDSVQVTDEMMRSQKGNLDAMLSYVEQLIASKRSASADDLVSFLLQAEQDGKIQYDDLVAMVLFLLLAGHETTISLIGNGLWLLLSHLEQWNLLLQQPKLIPNAVEEIVRYECPKQRSSFRITVKPMEIAGMSLQAGQQLGVIIGSANRDEAAFPDPDRFDIQRTPNRHLSFGLGIHNCLGKSLARLEGKVALGRIQELCPSLRLESDVPRWRRNSYLRGLETLPATLG